MDVPLLLARNSLRTSLVLVSIVVMVVTALVRKYKRMAKRRRADRDAAAALEASLGRPDHVTSGSPHAR